MLKMYEIIKRIIEKSDQPYFHSEIRYLSNLEVSDTSRLSKTSSDNFNELSNKRIELFTVDSSVNDLTAEEIEDINAFRSNTERAIRFTTADEFLEDLNN